MRVSTPGFLHRGQFASGQLLRGAEFLNSSNRQSWSFSCYFRIGPLMSGIILGIVPVGEPSRFYSPTKPLLNTFKLLRSIGFVEVRAEIDQVRQKRTFRPSARFSSPV